MRKVLFASVFSVLSLGLAGAAYGAGGPWYIAGGLTAAEIDKGDQVVANAPTPGSTLRLTNDIKTGWGGQVAVGRAVGPGRIEAELGFQDNEGDSYSTISPFRATLPQKATTDIRRAMVNGYYDFRDPERAFRPYVGLGLGVAEVRAVRINAVALAPTAPPIRRVDFVDTGLAWQAMAGVSYRIAPRWTLTGQYRYFDRGDLEGRDVRTEAVTIDLTTHNVDFGVRLNF